MTKDKAMQHQARTHPAFVLPPATAWTLRAWPSLLWQAAKPLHASFHHIDTCIVVGGDPENNPAGQTVWAAFDGELNAGMAWDWIQIARGVVAIADPMSLVTNVRLIGDEGGVMTAQESALFLNQLVRSLPWQQEVHRALNARMN